MPLSENDERELRALARDTYRQTRIGRPHLPHEDSEDGQRRIDRLFAIIAKPFENGAVR